MIVDAHAHFVPPALLDDLKAQRHGFPSVKVSVVNDNVVMSFGGDAAKRPVPEGMADVDGRRKWLKEQGIDKQVVAGWLDTFGYDIPAEEGADWNRYLNEHMLKAVKAYPFFVPLATVPMQSGKLAAQVLNEALDAGCKGAMIGTQPKGQSGVLDDPDLDPFWEAASARKATLFVHPTFGIRDDRLKDYGMVSAVGRVTDTTMAVGRLLFSGHLARYPGVRLILSHGGAALPMLLGRLRQSFATAPAKNSDPVEAFKRLYFDTVVYDPRIVRFVAEMSGVDRLLMGTDLPFAIADFEPLKTVDGCHFTAQERAAVVGGTAMELFGIKG